jgi:hypothetical protein
MHAEGREEHLIHERDGGQGVGREQRPAERQRRGRSRQGGKPAARRKSDGSSPAASTPAMARSGWRASARAASTMPAVPIPSGRRA